MRGWKKTTDLRGAKYYVDAHGDWALFYEAEVDAWILHRFSDADNADGVAEGRWVVADEEELAPLLRPDLFRTRLAAAEKERDELRARYDDCFEQLGVTSLADLVTKYDMERDTLRADRDRLSAEVAELRRENTALWSTMDQIAEALGCKPKDEVAYAHSELVRMVAALRQQLAEREEDLLSLRPLLESRFRDEGEIFIEGLGEGTAVCVACGATDSKMMISTHKEGCAYVAYGRAIDKLMAIDAARAREQKEPGR